MANYTTSSIGNLNNITSQQQDVIYGLQANLTSILTNASEVIGNSVNAGIATNNNLILSTPGFGASPAGVKQSTVNTNYQVWLIILTGAGPCVPIHALNFSANRFSNFPSFGEIVNMQ